MTTAQSDESQNGYSTTPQSQQTIESLWRLMKIILDSLDFKVVVQKIVDSALTELGYLKLGYSIVVLALVDQEKGVLKRISLSKTETAKKALAVIPVPFEDIIIPLNASANTCIEVLTSNRPQVVRQWERMLVPPFSLVDARRVQDELGIKASLIYPVGYRGKAQGIIIFSMEKEPTAVTEAERDLIRGYSDVVGLAVQHARLFSELEKTSLELKDANQRLKEMDVQKDEFISLAAHELRAPMTAIKGFLSMIMEGSTGEPIGPKTTRFIQSTMEGNDRLIRLVNNMLNVSWIEEGRMIYNLGVVNLATVVGTIFEEFKPTVDGKGLTFSLVIPPDIRDTVSVDQDRIYEVVTNLVSNAVKYTDRGVVTVRLRNPKQRMVRLEVEDTGRGITNEEQKKLFSKFSRAESSSGKTLGSGLGLYVSKLLVEAFKGTLGVESESGKGSVFWFELPLHEGVETH